ncbi:SDR family oxidoreductase [Sphingobium sp. Sx8-8]|uniref:SDR family oxidoreductase n=1 Tax=Sphingobium sp. Sx8-8 TaxID=2933617 RepID=UPI001F5AC39B|nr:SDR family oxidoreductase [Sphingobium sp. Sx8-8]
MQGRKAIVTGASRGMGRHLAQALVREGARVALLARPSAALDSTAREIGAQALPVGCDIADPHSVRNAFAAVEEAFGGLDILINNAGMSIVGHTESYSDTDIEQQIAVNFTGPVYTCRSAIPLLRQSAEPHIVNISSESVKVPYASLSLYAASKAALENYSAALRKELRDDRIRVTVLRSGFVGGSEMSRNWDEAEQAAFYEAAMSWGNFKETGVTPAAPEDMATALVELLTLPRELNVDLIELRPLAP